MVGYRITGLAAVGHMVGYKVTWLVIGSSWLVTGSPWLAAVGHHGWSQLVTMVGTQGIRTNVSRIVEHSQGLSRIDQEHHQRCQFLKNKTMRFPPDGF
jgi:hypothetical protein